MDKRAQPEEPPLVVDQRVVFAMKPEQRLKWLGSALQKLQQGKVQASIIYDMFVHSKFPKDASDKTGVRMFRSICAHIAFFSSKQQRFLETESKLAQLFKDKAQEAAADGEAGKGRSSGGDDPPDLNSLMQRLLTLTPSDGQELMDSLDSDTKDQLETLLEERILARARNSNPEEGSKPKEIKNDSGETSNTCSSSSSSSDDRDKKRKRSKRKDRSRSRSRS